MLAIPALLQAAHVPGGLEGVIAYNAITHVFEREGELGSLEESERVRAQRKRRRTNRHRLEEREAAEEATQANAEDAIEGVAAIADGRQSAADAVTSTTTAAGPAKAKQKGKKSGKSNAARTSSGDDEDIEPYAIYPYTLQFSDSVSQEQRDRIVSKANEIMEAVQQCYDNDRTSGILYYFAVVLHTCTRDIEAKLRASVRVRDRQHEALTERLRAVSTTAINDGDDGHGKREREFGGKEDSNVVAALDARAVAQQPPPPEESAVQLHSESGSDDESASDRSDAVDLTDSYENLRVFQMSVEIVAFKVLEGSLPMSAVLPLVAKFKKNLESFSVQPRVLMASFAAQQEQQLQDFRSTWVDGRRSFAQMVQGIAKLRDSTEGGDQALGTHEEGEGTAAAKSTKESGTGNGSEHGETVKRPKKSNKDTKSGTVKKIRVRQTSSDLQGSAASSKRRTAAEEMTGEIGADALYKSTSESTVDSVLQQLRATPLPWTHTALASMLRTYTLREREKQHKLRGAAHRGEEPSSPAPAPAEAAAVSATAERNRAALMDVADPLAELLLPDFGDSVFHFNEPFRLLAPLATPDEVRCFLRWTLADTTESRSEATSHSLADALSDVDGANADSDRATLAAVYNDSADAAPTTPTQVSGGDSNGGDLIDPSAAFLTFVHPAHGTVSLRLRNPLPFINFDIAGGCYWACDCCNNANIDVAFEAFVLETISDSRAFSGDADSFGYNVCLPCALHVYRAAMLRLVRALHPSPALRRGFEHGAGSRVVVRWLRAVTDGTGAVVVRAVVAVAPYAARPVGWVVSPAAHAEMSAAFPPPLCQAAELTERRRRALPVPPTPFTRHEAPVATVVSVSTLYSSDAEGGAASERPEDCPVCLQPLACEGPALRTKCGHWFHLACISALYSGGKEGGQNGEEPHPAAASTRSCPICRCTDFMPVLDPADVLARNVYELTLHLPADIATRYANAAGEVAVAIATLISPDGRFHNPTNVAACQLHMVKPVQGDVSTQD